MIHFCHIADKSISFKQNSTCIIVQKGCKIIRNSHRKAVQSG